MKSELSGSQRFTSGSGLLLLKLLILAEYQIAFHRWSAAVVGAVVLSKVVLVLEKGFEGRHAHGGFGPALWYLFRQADLAHMWANTLCLSGALLGYNALTVVRRHLGNRGLIRLFLSPLPQESHADELQPAEPRT